MRQLLIYSPAVRVMRGFRMDAAHGTPTIWEKLGAIFGLEGANNESILAGDERDLTKAEQEVLTVFQPFLHAAEADALLDLQNLTKDVLSGAGSVTSISGAVSLVEAAVAKEGAVFIGQVTSLGKTSLVTLVSAVLANLGHTNLPL